MQPQSGFFDWRPARRPFRVSMVLTAVLLLDACQSSEANQVSAPDSRVLAGEEITLAPGESVVATPGVLTLTFVRVTNESRCPLNATIQCLTGGTAAVALLATTVEGKRTLSIETQPGMDTVPIDRYQVQLVKLDPMPTNFDPVPPSSYRATIRLRSR